MCSSGVASLSGRATEVAAGGSRSPPTLPVSSLASLLRSNWRARKLLRLQGRKDSGGPKCGSVLHARHSAVTVRGSPYRKLHPGQMASNSSGSAEDIELGYCATLRLRSSGSCPTDLRRGFSCSPGDREILFPASLDGACGTHCLVSCRRTRGSALCLAMLWTGCTTGTETHCFATGNPGTRSAGSANDRDTSG